MAIAIMEVAQHSKFSPSLEFPSMLFKITLCIETLRGSEHELFRASLGRILIIEQVVLLLFCYLIIYIFVAKIEDCVRSLKSTLRVILREIKSIDD